MRINCTIDGTHYQLTENADKPLSKILQEQIESFNINSLCREGGCGNCVVMINGNCVLSCLVPAFRLNGAVIQTFESFRKTRLCHDIERAYAETGTQPCRQCYASKTMLIESLVNRLERSGSAPIITDLHEGTGNRTVVDREYIAREIGLNSCRCIEAEQLEKIINLACTYRSRRSGRKS